MINFFGGSKEKNDPLVLKTVKKQTDGKNKKPKESTWKHFDSISALNIGKKQGVGKGPLVLSKTQANSCVVFNPLDESGAVDETSVILGVNSSAYEPQRVARGVSALVEPHWNLKEIISVDASVIDDFYGVDDIDSITGKTDERQRFESLIYDSWKKEASDAIMLIYPGKRIFSQVRIHGDLRQVSAPFSPNRGREFLQNLARNAGVGDYRFDANMGFNYNYRFKHEDESFLLRCNDTKNADGSRSLAVRIKNVAGMRQAVDLSSLGYAPKDVEQMQTQMLRPYGAFLLTGVTGSGKTTTINALWDYWLKTNKVPKHGVSKRLITVQDPVERHFPGVLNIEVGGTEEEVRKQVAEANRNILRQDPDAVMYSEIRDEGMFTAMMSLARTGHLTGSTLHATNWAMAFARIRDDFGVSVKNLVREELLTFILSQTLLPIPCKACAISAAEALTAGLINKEQANEMSRIFGQHYSKLLFRADGAQKVSQCGECGGTGIVGRKVAYELFVVGQNPEPMKLVVDGRYGEAYRLWANSKESQGEPIANNVFRLAINGEADGLAAWAQIAGRVMSDTFLENVETKIVEDAGMEFPQL